MDALTQGCIPVLFSPIQDHFNSRFWRGDREKGRVLVDRGEFLRGALDLNEYLGAIAADRARLHHLRAEVRVVHHCTRLSHRLWVR